VNSLLEAVGVILTGVWALMTPGRKEARLRTAIHDDLALLGELESHPEFEAGTPSHAALAAWISTQVFALSSGQGRRRRAMNWTTLAYGAVMAAAFGWWTWRITTTTAGFPWYGWITAALAAAGVLAILGELTSPSGAASQGSAPDGASVDDAD
jgi:hypothetical protein